MKPPEQPRRRGGRYWARIFATVIAAALVVTLVFSGVGWRTPPRVLLEAFLVSLLFSTIIGPMLAIVMPHVARIAACRFAFPFDWVALIATMVVIAIAGSFTAIMVIAAV